jgi:hypothetical protein
LLARKQVLTISHLKELNVNSMLNRGISILTAATIAIRTLAVAPATFGQSTPVASGNASEDPS